MAYAPLTVTRRECLTALASVTMLPTLRAAAAEAKPMRGAFMILSTPYTAAGEVDYDLLGREVEFCDRCGAPARPALEARQALPDLEQHLLKQVARVGPTGVAAHDPHQTPPVGFNQPQEPGLIFGSYCQAPASLDLPGSRKPGRWRNPMVKK